MSISIISIISHLFGSMSQMQIDDNSPALATDSLDSDPQPRASKRAISEGRTRLAREIYAPRIPAQFQHLFDGPTTHALAHNPVLAASAQTTIATMVERQKEQNVEWVEQATKRFNQIEQTMAGTTDRQQKLEGTAQAIVTSLDTELLQIDKIQTAKSQTLTDHERALSAQREHQKELEEAAVIVTQQQQLNAEATKFVHGRVSTTEGLIGKAEQALQIMVDQHAKSQTEAATRQLVHEQETMALKQQVTKLIEENRIVTDALKNVPTHGSKFRNPRLEEMVPPPDAREPPGSSQYFRRNPGQT